VAVNVIVPKVCPAETVIVSREMPFVAMLPETAVPPSALYATVVPAGNTGVGVAAVEAVYDCPPVETFCTQTAPVEVVPCCILPKLIADGVIE
jgi:hypothetical protein